MKKNYEAPLVKVVDIQPEGLLMSSIISIDDTDTPAVGGEDGVVEIKGTSGKSIWDDQW